MDVPALTPDPLIHQLVLGVELLGLWIKWCGRCLVVVNRTVGPLLESEPEPGSRAVSFRSTCTFLGRMSPVARLLVPMTQCLLRNWRARAHSLCPNPTLTRCNLIFWHHTNIGTF